MSVFKILFFLATFFAYYQAMPIFPVEEQIGSAFRDLFDDIVDDILEYEDTMAMGFAASEYWDDEITINAYVVIQGASQDVYTNLDEDFDEYDAPVYGELINLKRPMMESEVIDYAEIAKMDFARHQKQYEYLSYFNDEKIKDQKVTYYNG